MQDFKKLRVWKKAHALALNATRLARRIRDPGYGSLRDQLIRAAMSIPTNIVEGRAKESDRDFARFLRYSFSSASELEYHLMIASDLLLISRAEFQSMQTDIVAVRKMIHALVQQLKSSPRMRIP
jgi:four helix bundle protein